MSNRIHHRKTAQLQQTVAEANLETNRLRQLVDSILERANTRNDAQNAEITGLKTELDAVKTDLGLSAGKIAALQFLLEEAKADRNSLAARLLDGAQEAAAPLLAVEDVAS